MTRLMISCGEPSGDLYAGALVAALRRREPDIDVFGLGGEQLQAAGGRLIANFDGLSVTGLTEVLRVLPRSWATMKALVQAARAEKPDALVVDRLSRLQFPADGRGQAARRAGDLLRQPAALGVARRPHQDDEEARRLRAADLSVRRSDLSPAKTSTSASSGIRSSTWRGRRARAKSSCAAFISIPPGRSSRCCPAAVRTS